MTDFTAATTAGPGKRVREEGAEFAYDTYPIDMDSFRPEGYFLLEGEPLFDPKIHLQLEPPGQVVSLEEFGYSAEEIATCPSNFAVTDVFRILSHEGSVCLYKACKTLEEFAKTMPRGTARRCRGGAYRSRFLRDLCLSKDVCDFMSNIGGVQLMPHTMPHQLGHLNFAPTDSTVDSGNIDKWHVDTLRYDYVMFVTDPKSHKGGQFQYFKGTKHEMAELTKAGKPLPADRLEAPNMPGPGYAVMMQGNMVVHQAKGLTEPGERISMVNGYHPTNPLTPDYTQYAQLLFVDPTATITAEYSRHVALQMARLLSGPQGVPGMLQGNFGASRQTNASMFKALALMADSSSTQILTDAAGIDSFGDS